MNDFGFSDQQKTTLSELLSRVKPRLPADRIKFFLLECEREIARTLKVFPGGWQVDERTPARLKTVGEAAYKFNAALRALSNVERLSIFAKLLAQTDWYGEGADLNEVSAEASAVERFLMKFVQEVNDLQLGYGTSVKDRLAEDIAEAIAISYVVAFKLLPSLRHDSAYKKFVDEISENCLPDNFRVSIGKHKMEMANERAGVHLDCMQLNTTVTEKT